MTSALRPSFFGGGRASSQQQTEVQHRIAEETPLDDRKAVTSDAEFMADREKALRTAQICAIVAIIIPGIFGLPLSLFSRHVAQHQNDPKVKRLSTIALIVSIFRLAFLPIVTLFLFSLGPS